MALKRHIPLLFVIVWTLVVGIAIGRVAVSAIEPPAWDALTYAMKAKFFWQRVGAGGLFNPFNIEWSARPPGTVLVSYPFGFSTAFQWQFFRSVYIPAVLFVVAVYVVGHTRLMTSRAQWLLAALAVLLASIPLVYQFQPRDGLLGSGYWGLVDGFFAAMSALAAACVVRSARTQSVPWAAIAATAAVLCFSIKPAGLIIMGLIGIIWLMLVVATCGSNIIHLRRDRATWRYIIVSGALAGAIYSIVLRAGFFSDYFSAANIAYGVRVLEIFKSEFNFPINAELGDLLIRTSFGYGIPILSLLGFIAALCQRHHRGAAVAAALCIAAGTWFVFFQAAIFQVRYVVPFGVMAFVVLVPALLAMCERVNLGLVAAISFVAILPAALITGLLVVPDPPLSLQRLAGVNLAAKLYGAEIAQAHDFERTLRAEKISQAKVYLFDSASPSRAFNSVLDYDHLVDQTAPNVTVLSPIDWQTPSAFRLDEIRRADFIAFTAHPDPATPAYWDLWMTGTEFSAQLRLMRPWLNGLGQADGLALLSETGLRLLRVADKDLFWASLDRLERTNEWPAAFRDANPQRWWSPAELERRAASADMPISIVNIGFHRRNGPAAFIIHAYALTSEWGGVRARVWVQKSAAPLPDEDRFLFTHLVDLQGNILAKDQMEFINEKPESTERSIRQYSFWLPSGPPQVVAVALGILTQSMPTAQPELLMADGGLRDWNNHRIIIRSPLH
jgi:hypothetical protein